MSPTPAAIQSLIEAHVAAFNSHDEAAFLAVFADRATIIDGIAPFHWPSPDGPKRWLADVAKWRAALGVTHEGLAYEMGFCSVEGHAAYAVITGKLTVAIGQQSMVRTGTLAYTFVQRDGSWKIDAQAWGRLA